MLHTWGSAMTHHPHVHMIVPGGGLSADASRWIACRPNFFLPVRVLSRLFRRLFLTMLAAAHEAGQLKFFGDHAGLTDNAAFATFLAPWAEAEWVVYAKEPFGGPEEVLRYLSRYTHRVAIEPPARLGRRRRRHVQMQGLPDRRTGCAKPEGEHAIPGFEPENVS